jgi:peroxiredoxin
VSSSSRRRRAAGGALVALWLFIQPAGAIEEGDVAPGFRLQDLVGDRVADSDSLFALRPWTLLIVWNTNCPDCMADYVAVGRAIEGAADVRLLLVGVSSDREKVGDARRLVKGTKLRFPNLWDAGGTTAAAYSARDHSFNAFLVDSTRVVRLAQHDRPPSVDEFVSAVWKRIGRHDAPGAPR